MKYHVIANDVIVASKKKEQPKRRRHIYVFRRHFLSKVFHVAWLYKESNPQA